MTRPPTREQHAREILGLPQEWKVYKQATTSVRPPFYGVTVTGLIPTETFKIGKRKGRTNWNKSDRSTEVTLTVPDVLHAAWLLQWERDTGKCFKCDGTGEVWAGWNHITGTKTRPCGRCREMLVDFTQLEFGT